MVMTFANCWQLPHQLEVQTTVPLVTTFADFFSSFVTCLLKHKNVESNKRLTLSVAEVVRLWRKRWNVSKLERVRLTFNRDRVNRYAGTVTFVQKDLCLETIAGA
jgi:hypothetical protein